MDRSVGKVMIAHIAGQREILQVGLCTCRMPIMIAQAGEEVVLLPSFSIAANIGCDKFMEELAYVVIDRF